MRFQTGFLLWVWYFGALYTQEWISPFQENDMASKINGFSILKGNNVLHIQVAGASPRCVTIVSK